MGSDDIRDALLIIIGFLVIIPYTAWHDEHYSYRIKIPKFLNILFLNQVKNKSVPLISFVTMLQFYFSLILLTIISINNGMNFNDLFYYYCFEPYILIVCPVTFIIDAIIGYKKRRVQKELNVKNNVINQKFKKKNRVNRKFKKKR